MKSIKKVFKLIKLILIFCFLISSTIFMFYIYYKTQIPSIDDIIKNNSTQQLKILYNDDITPIKLKNNIGINTLKFSDLSYSNRR